MRPKLQVFNPPNIPGGDMFQNMQEYQAWNLKQKFVKGYPFLNFQVGPNIFQNLSFPGTARFMFGLTVFDDSEDPLNTFTLNINEEDIITDASWINFSNNRTPGGIGTNISKEYVPIQRAIAGANDSVKITYNANTGGNVIFTFWFASKRHVIQL